MHKDSKIFSLPGLSYFLNQKERPVTKKEATYQEFRIGM